jgi:nitric oxide reductase subunit B
MNRITRAWLLLGGTTSAAFFLLGFFGKEVYRKAPPIPDRVVTSEGSLIFTRDDILTGQQVWQSTGGQQLGSIWGHGAYQAPDWSADWLHRESTSLLNMWASAEGAASFDGLPAERQAALKERLKKELRTNTFDIASETLTISPDRNRAVRETARHYENLFGGAPELRSLREAYAMQETVVSDPARLAKLPAFFF